MSLITPTFSIERIEGGCRITRLQSSNTQRHIIIPSQINDIPVLEIGPGAFANRKHLYDVYISDGIERIAESAFDGCVDLREVRLPQTLRTIETFAFFHCTHLRYIQFPKKVESIASHAFAGCSKLRTLVLPPKLTSIEDSVFKTCENLTHVILGHSVRYIGINAFELCPNLSFVDIPSPHIRIEVGAFAFHNLLTIRTPYGSGVREYIREDEAGDQIQLIETMRLYELLDD
jgi:hypothetical protein